MERVTQLFGSGMAEQLAKYQQDQARRKVDYEGKYGLSDLEMWQVRQITEAERQLKVCGECDGTKRCPYGYTKPAIEKLVAGYGVPYEVCRYGLLKRLERAFVNGQLPRRYFGKTFSDYEITEQNREAVGVAKWFLMKPADSNTQGVGIYYHGMTGSGKTFLAALIAKTYINQLKSVIFGDVPSLLERVKKTFDNPRQEQPDVLGQYQRCDLLVLDDLGVGKITEWNVGVIYQLVNERYNQNRPVIVTSNYDLEELQKRLSTGDEWSAQRIISRLREICIVKNLGQTDRRRGQESLFKKGVRHD